MCIRKKLILIKQFLLSYCVINTQVIITYKYILLTSYGKFMSKLLDV